jgi:flagellar motor switch protein FliM
MLGGPGSPNQPERPLSDIEAGLMRALVDRVLGELRYAFDAIARIEPQVSAVEYNPQFAQAASASDVVVVASFDLRIGPHESVATLCLPFGGLFPLLEAALGHGVTSEREHRARVVARRALETGLETVPVDVAVRFRPARVTPRTLVGLQPGDVLPLKHHVAAPLTVSAADVTFAHAVAGAQGRRLACLVVDSPAETSTPDAVPARRNSA